MLIILIYILTSNNLVALTQDVIPSENVSSAALKPDLAESGRTEYNVIGHSSQDAIIYDVVITPPNYDKTMLLTFAIHGFEGSWRNDGASLVQIANDVIREFSDHPEELQSTRLIVVPCVNPDGIWHGQTEKGVGRCNGQGIDINRDFDYNWKYNGESQYRTGKAPFTTPEAQILRDLVLKEKPDIVIDFHGWLNATYGDPQLSEYFDKAFNVVNQKPVSMDKVYMQQYFTGWASQFARAVLVEYPNPANPQNLIEWGYSYNTIKAIKEICKQI